jgi:hypothetical protein
MMTPTELIARFDAIVAAPKAKVTQDDRSQMAIALLGHGYTAGDACHKAFVELDDNDGALQMLARHRIDMQALSRQRRAHPEIAALNEGRVG